MALGKLALSALVVCSAAALAEEGTCAAEGGCDEVGLAQLRRAEARVALKVNASSKCSIGCDPNSNPAGLCPGQVACPANGCCDGAYPHINPSGCPGGCDCDWLPKDDCQKNQWCCAWACRDHYQNPADCSGADLLANQSQLEPAPTSSPSPPSGPCKVGCDPNSNPAGLCSGGVACPGTGCCDGVPKVAPCQVGCDPNSNPAGLCPGRVTCPGTGCCDGVSTPGAGELSANDAPASDDVKLASGDSCNQFCCWSPPGSDCGTCGDDWNNRMYEAGCKVPCSGPNCAAHQGYFNTQKGALQNCHQPGSKCY